MENNYLMHEGILGMRWGQRHGPPYPLDKNPSRQAALKRNSISDYPGGPARKAKSGPRHTGRHYDPRAEKIAARKARQEAKAAKRAERDEERRQKFEAEKAKTLRSGSAKDVLKYQGQLSNQELSEALNRIRMERELGSIAEQAKSGKRIVNKLISFTGKYGDAMGKVNKAITQTKAFLKNFESDNKSSANNTDQTQNQNKTNDKAARKKEKEERHKQRLMDIVRSDEEKRAKREAEQRARESNTRRYTYGPDDVEVEGSGHSDFKDAEYKQAKRGNSDVVIDAVWKEVAPEVTALAKVGRETVNESPSYALTIYDPKVAAAADRGAALVDNVVGYLEDKYFD